MDINVLKIAIEAQFKPSLTFYGKQGDIGNHIWEKIYPHWETDGKRIIFKENDLKEICIIEFRRVLVVKEDIGKFKKEKIPSQNFISAFKSYTRSLTDYQLLRLGFRLIGFCDCKMKFEEIVSVMQPKIYPDKKSKLYKITNSSFDDVAFTAIYKKNSKNVRFQCGPVTKEELFMRSQLGFGIDKEAKETLPDASIFFDVDVFKKKLLATEVEKFTAESIGMLEKDIIDFINYLLEE